MGESSSSQDYLKTILILQKKNGLVRSVDVATEMNVTKASVCNAMKKLKKKDLIFFDEEGHIFFTPSGEKTAEGIYSKHLLLAKLLIISGVDEETAEQEACLMEHDISDETYGRLKEILDLYTSEEYKGVCQNCRFRPEMIMDICNCKNQQ